MLHLSRRTLFWLFLAVLALVLQACSSSSPVDSSSPSVATEASDGSDSTTTTVSVNPDPAPESSDPNVETTEAVVVASTPVVFDDNFGESVLPILEDRCASCHNAGGPGSPHFVLETANDAASEAELIGHNVETGYMPPWIAGPLSVSFHNERGLSPEQRTAILDWVQSGAAIDVDPTTPIVAQEFVGLDRIDHDIAPARPYAGSPQNVDDYRCQIYDPEFTEATWVTGYNFEPDQSEVVHHAIGYAIPADQRQAATDRDAEDPGAGWTCFGSSELGNDDIILGWAPGQLATKYPEGSGLPMDTGDFFVVQIHYHYEGTAPADASSLQIETTDGSEALDTINVLEYLAPAEIPCSSEETGPLCDRDAALAAAIDRYGRRGVQANTANAICGVTPDDFADMTDGIAWSSCDLPIYGVGQIVSVLGHEHEIGSSFRLTLNPDTADEKILLDIPEWDFDWQYNYYPVEEIMVGPGDSVRIECSWDRSLRDPDLEPAYVLWADGTNDEMCFSTIALRES